MQEEVSKMDWSYVDIPVTPRYKVRLFREKKMLHNVKDPRNWKMNLYILEVSKLDLGTYVVMDEHDEPIVPPKAITESLSDGVWTYAL
jgi:hypothetical protein